MVTSLPAIPPTFALGVCDYPEHVPWEQWKRYPGRQRELGITYVRIAEFAWSKIEPREGEFDWTWLDDAVQALADAGRLIVMCTPTATPPAWLIRKHPEILPVGKDGHIRNFGSRKHYDHASPIYREHSRRITRAVAERYGQHPAVAGWQTDNEWGCHSTTRSYGGASQTAFRSWLERRYGTLEALNAAWGNVFWSQEYTDWGQVDPPNQTVAEPNPSHVLDFARFASDMVNEFQGEQVAILRELSPGRWITHNYMMQFMEFDHYANCEVLDFASWDSYPLGQVERSDLPDTEKLRWARTGHPDLISWNHDVYRGLKGRRAFWVMEQGVGQVNWAASNCLPAGGAAALWTAQAYAHGASCVSYFRWRAAMIAQELMHSGLLRHDETFDRGGEEVGGLELHGLENADVPARVALLHDYESQWIYDEQPHSEGASYVRQAMLFYGVLRSLGVDVDIRHPDHDLSGYDVIVAPAIQLMGEDRARHLASYAETSRLVFGPRTAYRTPTGRVHEDGQPGPLRGLVGHRLLNFDGMRSGLTVRAGGHVVETWAESYEPVGADVLVTYDDGPLTGQAAVTRHGNTLSVGVWSATLLESVLAQVLTEAGVAVTPLPEGVRVARRGGTEIWMNFNQEPATLPDGSTMGPVSFRLRGQVVRPASSRSLPTQG
ncbi:MAG: beta-galactosidase [Thermomicrobiales bacterium]|nr:beta-galactosidase [Thermomicrobiales bacterium]